jgi:hypothetical protein
MEKPLSALALIGALACLSLPAQAQSSPIPESPMPGFGGADTWPAMPGGSPGSSGSNVGSNVGAGATASPIPDIITPATSPEIAEAPSGSSGSITITR